MPVGRSARALLAALLLAGCATAPPPRPGGLPARSELQHFELEARFALKVERPNEAVQSASGRLSWNHEGTRDRVLIADPLGQGIAEIDSGPAGARLRGSDGKVRTGADAASLVREATGYPFPVKELPGWLLGRPGSGGRLTNDALGRPSRLFDAGWRIDYSYDEDSAEALPARLTIGRDNDLELRLRIEEWRAP